MAVRALIVEDEFLVAMELEHLLEDMGVEVVGVAADSRRALAIAGRKPVDLALVDVNLLDGETGPQVGETLAKQHGARVLFITANPALLGDGVDGAIGVISKPWSGEAVTSAVDYVMARRDCAPPPELSLFRQL